MLNTIPSQTCLELWSTNVALQWSDIFNYTKETTMITTVVVKSDA